MKKTKICFLTMGILFAGLAFAQNHNEVVSVCMRGDQDTAQADRRDFYVDIVGTDGVESRANVSLDEPTSIQSSTFPNIKSPRSIRVTESPWNADFDCSANFKPGATGAVVIVYYPPDANPSCKIIFTSGKPSC